MWAWGYNGQGQIGDSSNVASRSSPVQIGALTNWAQVVIGGALRPSFAINTTGELYAWGPFNYGQRLFVGSGGANTSSPTQVGAGVSGWTQIGTGQNFAGIKDGNVFAAGRGVQVGPGPTSSPVQITSSGDWAGVAPLSSGTSFNTVALKTNGTLWSFTNSSSPTQVGTASDWSFTNNRLNKMYPPGNAGYTSGTKIFIRTFISNPA
jgi:alpha-tubulin suppressor-like RCC1 family protein